MEVGSEVKCPCGESYTEKSKVIDPWNHSVKGLLCIKCMRFESFRQGEEYGKIDKKAAKSTGVK